MEVEETTTDSDRTTLPLRSSTPCSVASLAWAGEQEAQEELVERESEDKAEEGLNRTAKEELVKAELEQQEQDSSEACLAAAAEQGQMEQEQTTLSTRTLRLSTLAVLVLLSLLRPMTATVTMTCHHLSVRCLFLLSSRLSFTFLPIFSRSYFDRSGRFDLDSRRIFLLYHISYRSRLDSCHDQPQRRPQCELLHLFRLDSRSRSCSPPSIDRRRYLQQSVELWTLFHSVHSFDSRASTCSSSRRFAGGRT
jgi:hypothetical protein